MSIIYICNHHQEIVRCGPPQMKGEAWMKNIFNWHEIYIKMCSMDWSKGYANVKQVKWLLMWIQFCQFLMFCQRKIYYLHQCIISRFLFIYFVMNLSLMYYILNLSSNVYACSWAQIAHKPTFCMLTLSGAYQFRVEFGGSWC